MTYVPNIIHIILAERLLILIPSQHHQILDILVLAQVLHLLDLKIILKVIQTSMESLLYCLIMKEVTKSKTWIGSQGHNHHCQRKPHFISRLLGSYPLVMVAALLRLSSMVSYDILVFCYYYNQISDLSLFLIYHTFQYWWRNS